MKNANAKGIVCFSFLSHLLPPLFLALNFVSWQQMDEPFDVFEESPSLRRAPVSRRVDDMFNQIKTKLPGAPRFLLCLLPERKNCEIYGWLIVFIP